MYASVCIPLLTPPFPSSSLIHSHFLIILHLHLCLTPPVPSPSFPLTSSPPPRLLSFASCLFVQPLAEQLLMSPLMNVSRQLGGGMEGRRSGEVEVRKDLGGIEGVKMEKKYHLTLCPPYLSLLHFLCPFVLFTFIPSSCFPSFLASLLLPSSSQLLFLSFHHSCLLLLVFESVCPFLTFSCTWFHFLPFT